MKKRFGLVCMMMVAAGLAYCQAARSSSNSFWKPQPANYHVRQAWEVETLFPMFLYGGYHLGVGYRYEKLRVRVSVIDGGSYNADNGTPDGPIDGYERRYKPSPGFFLGFNTWKNLELYGYYEYHTFEIRQLATAQNTDLVSHDLGIGLSYQFFVGRTLYLQPGIHTYFRTDKEVGFKNGGRYAIPTFELTPVIRLGARIWREHY